MPRLADFYIRRIMRNDLSSYSTRDLLQLAAVENDRDLVYKAFWTVFRRWENGDDLSVLVDFIESKDANDRLRAAYFLFEVSPPSDMLKIAVLKLADDVMPECRRAFVGYLLDSGWYDETAAQGLVKGIQDFDVRVRLKVIDWAIKATDEQFDDFSRRLSADTANLSAHTWKGRFKKRAIRALHIASEVRCGASVDKLRATIQEEDSFTFDHLDAFVSHHRRRREQRHVPRDQP
ncbi:hypothetical protein GOZ78_08660 [Agrobacterium vitis]|uniref:HEAT repeat domain-containing protein n=1 Tax=Agrobacterium vitis TaxID=373 RepID=A0ABD6GB71_AGRVI|nr:hypothetical protein [Agrobacterium vitis]MUO78112.1 hypothetical protein [Agrobacterium vitis]MUO93990.1 hypothetical protein [Agrobacterium vitis]MUP03556.1 hypothetical protein [Agrobacterium vitis]MUZ85103.1 hypothetical protein [Agrobacterium vitis]MVA10103.1 hypothetical protein [Agrobacterium vitis]